MKAEITASKNGEAESTRRKRRSVIPDKPEHPLNLWSIMRSCIGKVKYKSSNVKSRSQGKAVPKKSLCFFSGRAFWSKIFQQLAGLRIYNSGDIQTYTRVCLVRQDNFCKNLSLSWRGCRAASLSKGGRMFGV